MNLEINLFGFVADAFVLLGVWVLGKKKIQGWYIGLVGCFLSVLYAIWIRSLPIFFVDGVFVALYARNIILWRKED